jgi:hypothetical protein
MRVRLAELGATVVMLSLAEDRKLIVGETEKWPSHPGKGS